VDEEKMRIVRRIFQMRGVEGLSQNAVYHALEREGIPTPGGGKYWDRAFIKLCILDDAYRPVLERSLGYICAYQRDELIGFVNLA